MAFSSGNADRPFGFVPVRHMTGGIIRQGRYHIADGLASNLYYGAPVKLTGTGKEIDLAAAGEKAVGVFAGVQYTDDSGELQWKAKWTSGTSIQTGSTVDAFVIDDPNVLFEIQGDEDIVAADIGNTADWVNPGTGDDATGRSQCELDSSDISTGAGLKIVELIDRPDNDYGTSAKVGVLFNEHEYLNSARSGT